MYVQRALRRQILDRDIVSRIRAVHTRSETGIHSKSFHAIAIGRRVRSEG